MAVKTVEERLEKVFNRYEKKLTSGGMAFSLEKRDGSFTWNKETGNLVGDMPYAIASITKMYTATVIYKLVDEGRISLEDKAVNHLEDWVMDKIHVYKGVDYSKEITIGQMLSHTSGIGDYYTEKSNEYVAVDTTFSEDKAFAFEEIITRTKALKPHFIPGTKGKAYYSDINFDILGIIIEKITGISLEDNYIKYIYTPLSLKNTYLYREGMEYNVPPIVYKGIRYKVSKILGSAGASGGIVATKSDNMIFLKAFFQGKLFAVSHVEEMKKFNRIQFFPMQYGGGIMRFVAPASPELIGHSGSTGTLCYYAPKYNVYITGAINECKESKVIQLACQLVYAFRKS